MRIRRSSSAWAWFPPPLIMADIMKCCSACFLLRCISSIYSAICNYLSYSLSSLSPPEIPAPTRIAAGLGLLGTGLAWFYRPIPPISCANSLTCFASFALVFFSYSLNVWIWSLSSRTLLVRSKFCLRNFTVSYRCCKICISLAVRSSFNFTSSVFKGSDEPEDIGLNSSSSSYYCAAVIVTGGLFEVCELFFWPKPILTTWVPLPFIYWPITPLLSYWIPLERFLLLTRPLYDAVGATYLGALYFEALPFLYYISLF